MAKKKDRIDDAASRCKARDNTCLGVGERSFTARHLAEMLAAL
jgi:hypothetical protein